MEEPQRKPHPPWRKPVVTVAGGTVLVVGTVMLVTPGPGLVVIAGGLALLGTEYKWPRRVLHNVRERIRVKGQGEKK